MRGVALEPRDYKMSAATTAPDAIVGNDFPGAAVAASNNRRILH